MRTKSISQHAFFNLRGLTVFTLLVAGISLALLAADTQFAGSPVRRLTNSTKRSDGPFPTIQLAQIVSGLTSPVTVTNAGDGSGRLFVVQQTGQIRIVIGGTILPNPFLDISNLVSCCGEQGLLGLAFHPDYASNGFFYIDYTDLNGNTVVARYTVSANDPNVADPQSAQIVLIQEQPFSNHNGGQLVFGPDDYLYIAFGVAAAGAILRKMGKTSRLG